MGYHRVGGLRVEFMRRDCHEMNLDLALREKAISEKWGRVRDEKSSWVEKKGQTLKRNRLNLGWGQ